MVKGHGADRGAPAASLEVASAPLRARGDPRSRDRVARETTGSLRRSTSTAWRASRSSRRATTELVRA